MMTFGSMEPAPVDDPNLVRQQRDQAMACAILSTVIMLAVLLTNFGPESVELQRAREGVRLHRESLAQHREILRANEAVLQQNQAELERVRPAVNPPSP